MPAEGMRLYLATQSSVWFRYLGLAIFPIPLNVDHEVVLLHLTDLWSVLSFAGAFAIALILSAILQIH